MEGEGDIRAYNLTRLDQQRDELVDLVRLLLRSRGTANTETNQKNALSAKKRKEVLELIDAINARTELRRALRAAEVRTEHNRARRQQSREDSQPTRTRDRDKPIQVVPIPPSDAGGAYDPTDVPPFTPPFYIPEPTRTTGETLDAYPTPSEPITPPERLKRPRTEDFQNCEEVAEFFRQIGLPPPVCTSTSGRATSIRGGRNI